MQNADCKRNLVVLEFFDMILKTILCVQDFCSFGAMFFTVNLLIKTDPLLFMFLVCLSMFVMIHFLLNIADLEDILC